MNYTLNQNKKSSSLKSYREIFLFLKKEYRYLAIGLFFVLLTSVLTIIAPLLLGITIDEVIAKGLVQELLFFAGLFILIYFVASISNYLQIITIGMIGVRSVFELRFKIFEKLGELPQLFFNKNKSGELISRINNDTDILNGFFSEVLVRFASSIFTLVGIGLFLLILNFKLALISFSSLLILLIYLLASSSIIKKINRTSLDSNGNLTGEIQENIQNYKVIVAFNKQEFFRNRLERFININYLKTVYSTIANNLSVPVYNFIGNLANLLVLVFGLTMIFSGEITIGTLISFIVLVDRFYEPLRLIASLFGEIQRTTSAWERVQEILNLKSNLLTNKNLQNSSKDVVFEFKDVKFGYSEEKIILENLNFVIEKGKKYAIVGPTGGGKSTLAGLMTRLFDPLSGEIFLRQNNLKTYSRSEITHDIGYIVQDPILFDGSIRENLCYGNNKLKDSSTLELQSTVDKLNLKPLLHKINKDLNFEIKEGGIGLSLGQKQIIAFLRALLRNPRVLIMDEATANIDTITEQLLQNALNQLPENTTLITIAHRLNTIKSADEIFLIAEGRIKQGIKFVDIKNEIVTVS